MQSVLTQLSDYLWNQSLQIAGLVILVVLATWALRKASSHWPYLLWCLVLAKCLVPPLLTIPLAIMPERPIDLPAAASEPFTSAPAILDYEVSLGELPPIPAQAIPERTESPIRETLPAISVREWMAIGWLAGLTLFLAMALVKGVRTNSWLKKHRTLADVEVEMEDLAATDILGVKSPPGIWMIEGMGQPFVWGLLKG